jgi:hypothetical protein
MQMRGLCLAIWLGMLGLLPGAVEGGTPLLAVEPKSGELDQQLSTSGGLKTISDACTPADGGTPFLAFVLQDGELDQQLGTSGCLTLQTLDGRFTATLERLSPPQQEKVTSFESNGVTYTNPAAVMVTFGEGLGLRLGPWQGPGAMLVDASPISNVNPSSVRSSDPKFGLWKELSVKRIPIDSLLAIDLNASGGGSQVYLLNPSTLSSVVSDPVWLLDASGPAPVLATEGTLSAGNYLIAKSVPASGTIAIDSNKLFPAVVTSSQVSLPTGFPLAASSWAGYPVGAVFTFPGGWQAQLDGNMIFPTDSMGLIKLWQALATSGTIDVSLDAKTDFTTSWTAGKSPDANTWISLSAGPPSIALASPLAWTGAGTVYGSNGSGPITLTKATNDQKAETKIEPGNADALQVILSAESTPIGIAPGAAMTTFASAASFDLLELSSSKLVTPTMVAVAAPVQAAPQATTVDPAGQVIKNASVAQGALDLPYTSWKGLTSTGDYVVFPEATTSGAEILSYSGPSTQTLTGSFGAATAQVVLTPSGSPSQTSYALTRASSQVSLSLQNNQWVMSAADWDTVSANPSGWSSAAGTFAFTPSAGQPKVGQSWGSFSIAQQQNVMLVSTEPNHPLPQASWNATIGGISIEQYVPLSTTSANLILTQAQYQQLQQLKAGSVQLEISYGSNTQIWQGAWNGTSPITGASLQHVIIAIPGLQDWGNLPISVTEIWPPESSTPKTIISDVLQIQSSSQGAQLYFSPPAWDAWKATASLKPQNSYFANSAGQGYALASTPGAPGSVAAGSIGVALAEVPFGLTNFSLQENAPMTVSQEGGSWSGTVKSGPNGSYVLLSGFPYSRNTAMVKVTSGSSSIWVQYSGIKCPGCANFPWGILTVPVPNCDQLLLDFPEGPGGWTCGARADQASFSNLLTDGTVCAMYQCSALGKTVLSGNPGCQIHAGLSGSSTGQTSTCYPVLCSAYGGWMGVGLEAAPVAVDTGVDSQCQQVESPSLSSNKICVWCPDMAQVSNFGGVAPYMPSVHGYLPAANGGNGFPQSGYSAP